MTDRGDAVTNETVLVDLGPGDARWKLALPVLQELRPHLTEQLLVQVLAQGTPQGLRFTAVFVAERCVAVAGWRVIVNTGAIRKLYVDDLSTTASERSHGYGRMLLDSLREKAIDAGCHSLELDSGVQRFDAHRFYLSQRMNITAHHFALRL